MGIALTDATLGQELADAKVGKPKVGGPFALKDQNGKTFTQDDLLGKFSLVYVRVE